MSAAITLEMLRAASSAEFPVIDLGEYMRGDAGALDRVAAQLRRVRTILLRALPDVGHLAARQQIVPRCGGQHARTVTEVLERALQQSLDAPV
jgi:hypothetical protein